jgi:signal transduction histidine kinase
MQYCKCNIHAIPAGMVWGQNSGQFSITATGAPFAPFDIQCREEEILLQGRENIFRNLTTFFISVLAGCLEHGFTGHSSVLGPAWIPSGIGLAAVLLYGYRVVPAIALAGAVCASAFFESMLHWNVAEASLQTSIIVGIAAALQAALGRFLIQIFIGWPNTLILSSDAWKFLFLGGPAACLLRCTCAWLLLKWEFYDWFTCFVGDTLGVLIVAPIALTLFEKPHEVWRRRILGLAIPLGIALSLAALAYRQTRAYEFKTIEAGFGERAQLLIKRFEDELQVLDRVPLLFKTHALLDRDGKLSAPEFQHLSETFFAIFPTIDAVAWDDVVQETSRRSYEREQARALRKPGFRIWELGPGGSRIPAQSRDRHLVIRWVRSNFPGMDLAGFDAFSRNEKLKSAAIGVDRKASAAVPSIPLFDRGQGSPVGLLIYNPVFYQNVLQGCLTVVIRLGQTIEAATKAFFDNRNDLAVKVSAGSDGEIVFEKGRPAKTTQAASVFKFETTIELKNIKNARWLVQVYPTQEYFDKIRPLRSWLVLAGGLLICGFLSGFLLALSGASEIQRSLARQLGNELSEKEKAHKSARMLETDLARIWRINTVGEMATSLAHELSQPLSSIRNYAQGILGILQNRELDDPDIRDSLIEISNEAGRAGDYIGNIRAFMANKEPVRKIEKVNSIITEIMALCDHELNTHQVKFTVVLTHEQVRVHVDRIQVGQVFLNLIRNAIESVSANEPEERRLSVVVSVEEPSVVQVSFRDNGCGISEKHLERIFQPFFTTKSSGMGMGLAISKTVIEAHSGELICGLNPDRGMTFSVRLPRAREEHA